MRINLLPLLFGLLAGFLIQLTVPTITQAGSYYMSAVLDDGDAVSRDIYHFNRDKVRIGFFYQPESEKTQDFFPQFLDLADQARQQGVAIIPYSLNSSSLAITFLSEAPEWFTRQAIHNRKASEVISSLRDKGHDLQNRIDTPYVFVIDNENYLLFERQGLDDIGPVIAALKSAGVDITIDKLSKSSVGKDFSSALTEMNFKKIVSLRKVPNQIGEQFKNDFFDLYRHSEASFRTVKLTDENQDDLSPDKEMKKALGDCSKQIYVHSMEDKRNKRRIRAFYCADEKHIELLSCFYQYADDNWVVVDRNKPDMYYGPIVGAQREQKIEAWSGQVTDAETERPVMEALIVKVWGEVRPVGLGRFHTFLQKENVLTDSDGSFDLPKVTKTGTLPPIIGLEQQPYLIYKPGYRAVFLDSPSKRIFLERIPTTIESRSEEVRAIHKQYDWLYELRKDSQDIVTETLDREEEFLDILKTLDRQSSITRPEVVQRPLLTHARSQFESIETVNASESDLEAWAKELLSADYTVRQKAKMRLVAAKADSAPYIIPILSKAPPERRDEIAILLGEIADPRSIKALCTQMKPEKNQGKKPVPLIGSSQRVVTFKKGEKISNTDKQANHFRPSIPHSSQKPLEEVGSQKKYAEVLQNNRTIAAVLGNFPDPEASHCLVEDVRRNPGGPSVNALKGQGPVATSEIIKALDDPDPVVRSELYSILGSIGDSGSVDALLMALQDSDSGARLSAVRAIAHAGDKRAVPNLIAILKQRESPKICDSASYALMQIGGPAVDSIIELFEENDSYMHWRAALILGGIDDDRSRDALINLLDNKSPEIQIISVYGLGLIGDNESIKALKTLEIDTSDTGIKDACSTSITWIAKRLDEG